MCIICLKGQSCLLTLQQKYTLLYISSILFTFIADWYKYICNHPVFTCLLRTHKVIYILCMPVVLYICRCGLWSIDINERS